MTDQNKLTVARAVADDLANTLQRIADFANATYDMRVALGEGEGPLGVATRRIAVACANAQLRYEDAVGQDEL